MCERNLHLVRQHNSGIPLLKSDNTSQIKSYRLNLEHKKELLSEVQNFDRLHIQEPVIPLAKLNENHEKLARAHPRKGMTGSNAYKLLH